MAQTAIPYYFLRAGTSRGSFFNRKDLPEDPETLSAVLVSAVGSGHPLNIDGIGGGSAITTKVAILSRSSEKSVDIDYFFAQVGVESCRVDYKPSCGNIMVGVGPVAIEMGLIDAEVDSTQVKIRAVNTSSMAISTVQTPGGTVKYDGDTTIDGVPGSASPIKLQFMDTIGSATGKLLPTGQLVNTVEGIDVSLHGCCDSHGDCARIRFWVDSLRKPRESQQQCRIFIHHGTNST